MAQEPYSETAVPGGRWVTLNTIGSFNTGPGNDHLQANYDIPSVLGGGQGNDRLEGSYLGDTIMGGQGNDVVQAFRGDDIVYGGKGSDIIDGDEGNDLLFGAAGKDQLAGDDGSDTLVGGAGDDIIEGGEGADYFGFDALTGLDSIRDFDGSEGDRLSLRAGSVARIDETQLRTEGMVHIYMKDGSMIQVIMPDLVDLVGSELEPLVKYWDASYILYYG